MNTLFTVVAILITELVIGVIGAVLFELTSRKDEDE